MRRDLIIIAAIVIGLFLSPYLIGALWIAGGAVYGKLEQRRYASTTDFRPADWKRPDLKYRYAVLDFVATNVVAAGMSQGQVEQALGKPNAIRGNNAWQYETQRPGWHFIDFSGGGLLVDFDSTGHVTRVTKNLYAD